MQRQQGPGHVLLKPSTTEGQVANLLALGIEQEGAHGRRNHIRPRRGPDHGWSNRGNTCRGKDSEQRERETRVGREREQLLSHRPEPPKTSKVLKPRQMCSRCSFKEILISRVFFSRINYVNHCQLLGRKTITHLPQNKAVFGVFFLLFKGKKPEPELCQLLFGAPG